MQPGEKRGRIVPITVMPCETMTNYPVAASLRCNFDNQSLVYLPPASIVPLLATPNIGRQPQYAHMERSEGDLEPKWLVPLPDDLDEAMVADGIPESVDYDALIKELESVCLSAFQDAHNAGFYINEYTTKIHSLGEKLLNGLRRAA